MARTKFVPGFRFHPTDVELVKYYLKRKLMGKKFAMDVIAEVDIYKYAPWDLPDKSSLQTGDLEWYFFCPKGVKYASGARMNRATEVGYWKTTGRDRPIQNNSQTVGKIRTLIFHRGHAPHGERTDWVMHEYRLEGLEEKDLTDKGIQQDSYMLCKVFQKDGPGPRNGSQYGRPFNEDDWKDDDKEIGGVESILSAAMSPLVPMLPVTPSSSVATHMQNLSASGCIGQSSPSCLAEALPSSCMMHPPTSSIQVTSNNDPLVAVDDDIISLLDFFCEEDDALALNQNNNTEDSQRVAEHGLDNAEGEDDIFKDLGDLGFASLRGGGHDFSFGHISEYTPNQVLPALDGPRLDSYNPDYLELRDLYPPLFNQTEHGSWGASQSSFETSVDKIDK